jgi:hypothetical protein
VAKHDRADETVASETGEKTEPRGVLWQGLKERICASSVGNEKSSCRGGQVVGHDPAQAGGSVQRNEEGLPSQAHTSGKTYV